MKAQQEDRDRLTGCCLVFYFNHVFLSIVEPFNNDTAYAAGAATCLALSSTTPHITTSAARGG
jgi:hypothetical protein